MSNGQAASSDSPQSAAAEPHRATASDAIAAIVDAGARALIAEPWRAGRIIRETHELTIDELAAQAAHRRRAGPPADLNQAIALAQLILALKSPRFCAAWTDLRNSATSQPTTASGDALCE
jgi:hypothetical protein